MTDDGDVVEIRPAHPDDVPDIARIWQSGWREVHLGRVPDALITARTPESFVDRAAGLLADTIVATRQGGVAGFVMIEADEVQQVYVDGAHRGTSVAAELLAAAEHRIATTGFDLAWLAVVAGNERARRFYRRSGWVDRGLFDHAAPGPNGPITVPAHRYEKRLDR